MTRRDSKYTQTSITACAIVALIGVAALNATSCSLDKGGTAQQPGTLPPGLSSPLPSATPTSLASEAGFQPWLRIDAVFEGDYPLTGPQGACQLPRRASITREGIITVSPCREGEPAPAPTRLAGGAYQRLIQLGDEVTRGDPSGPQTCDERTDLGKLTVDLNYASDQRSRVYDLRADRPLACYRGGQANARALAEEVRRVLGL